MADFRKKFLEYTAIRRAFDDEAEAYWNSIIEKRKARNAKRRGNETIVVTDYVLTQPPVYGGPKRPVNPEPSPLEPAEPQPRKTIPVVADLLKAAAEHFQFAPQRPAQEAEFRRAYARAASAV